MIEGFELVIWIGECGMKKNEAKGELAESMGHSA